MYILKVLKTRICSLRLPYFVNSQDYVAYLDTQQRVNLALKTAFEKEGISFAYPTQTLYVNS